MRRQDSGRWQLGEVFAADSIYSINSIRSWPRRRRAQDLGAAPSLRQSLITLRREPVTDLPEIGTGSVPTRPAGHHPRSLAKILAPRHCSRCGERLP